MGSEKPEVLWGVYGRKGVILSDGRKIINFEGLELKKRIPAEIFIETTGKIGERSKEDAEARARDVGANLVCKPGNLPAKEKGYYYLLYLNNARPTITVESARERAVSTPEKVGLAWGKPYFNQEGEVGKRFGVRLEGIERIVFLSELKHLGTLGEYKPCEGKLVAREVEEVEKYARGKYGIDAIIVPSTERDRRKAHFNFYKERGTVQD